MSTPALIDPNALSLASIGIAAATVALGFAAWLVFWRGTAAALVRMQRELQRQQAARQADGEEMQRLAQAILGLENRLEGELRYGGNAPRARASGYEMAIRMAVSGATDTELMAACGMSREEAMLVQRLHGKRTLHAA